MSSFHVALLSSCHVLCWWLSSCRGRHVGVVWHAVCRAKAFAKTFSLIKNRRPTTLRYRRGLNHKPCRLEIGGRLLYNTGKLTRSRHSKDWQIDTSFFIFNVVVHGRSQLVKWIVWLISLTTETFACYIVSSMTFIWLPDLLFRVPITELGNFYPLPVLFLGRSFFQVIFFTGFIPQNLIGNHFCQHGNTTPHHSTPQHTAHNTWRERSACLCTWFCLFVLPFSLSLPLPFSTDFRFPSVWPRFRLQCTTVCTLGDLPSTQLGEHRTPTAASRSFQRACAFLDSVGCAPVSMFCSCPEACLNFVLCVVA